MARVTRAEGVARTREGLLDAAAEVFAEKGFTGASVEEIADRAGRTKGAVYANFANKDDLFIAVLDRYLAAAVIDAETQLADVTDPSALPGALRPTTVMRDKGSRTAYLLCSEFRLYALRNAAVGEKLAAHERSVLAAYEAQFEAVIERLAITPPLPAARLAAIFQCLGLGLEYLHHLDPDGPSDDTLADALQVVLAAANRR